MAAAIQMKQRDSGIRKQGYYGFSWTSFFFGGFPALFRGDLGYGLAILVVCILCAAFSFGALWFVVGLIWAFIYNKQYTQRLIQAGYEFDDLPERVTKAKHALNIASPA